MKKPTTKKAKKVVKAITAEQLQNLSKDLRDIINTHILENDLSKHAFAKKCKIHPTQLYMFLEETRGLNLPTVQRIGNVINGAK